METAVGDASLCPSYILDGSLQPGRMNELSHLLDDDILKVTEKVFVDLQKVYFKPKLDFGQIVLSVLSPIKNQLDYIQTYCEKSFTEDVSGLWPTEVVTNLYNKRNELQVQQTLELISTDNDTWSLYASLSIALFGTTKLQYYIKLLIFRYICENLPTEESDCNNPELKKIIESLLRDFTDVKLEESYKWICAVALRTPILDCVFDRKRDICKYNYYSSNLPIEKESPVYLFSCQGHVLPLIPKYQMGNESKRAIAQLHSLKYRNTMLTHLLTLLDEYTRITLTSGSNHHVRTNVMTYSLTARLPSCLTCAAYKRHIDELNVNINTFSEIVGPTETYNQEIKRMDLRLKRLICDNNVLEIECKDLNEKIDNFKNNTLMSSASAHPYSTTTGNQESETVLGGEYNSEIDVTTVDDIANVYDTTALGPSTSTLASNGLEGLPNNYLNIADNIKQCNIANNLELDDQDDESNDGDDFVMVEEGSTYSDNIDLLSREIELLVAPHLNDDDALSSDPAISSILDSSDDMVSVRDSQNIPREDRDLEHPLISKVVTFKLQGKVRKVRYSNLVENTTTSQQPPKQRLTKKRLNRDMQKCLFCARYIETLDELKEHILQKHVNHSNSSTPIIERVIPEPSTEHIKQSLPTASSRKINKITSEPAGSNNATKRLNKTKQTAKRVVNSIKENSSEPKFRCRFCGRTNFSSRYALKRHQDCHTKNNRFPCPHCDYSCPRSDYLKSHIERKHKRLREYPCPKCKQMFHGFKTYSNHYSVKHFTDAIAFGSVPSMTTQNPGGTTT